MELPKRRILMNAFFKSPIIHKILETNSSFHVKQALQEKFKFRFSRVFASINKIVILPGGLGTRLSFYGVYAHS